MDGCTEWHILWGASVVGIEPSSGDGGQHLELQTVCVCVCGFRKTVQPQAVLGLQAEARARVGA